MAQLIRGDQYAGWVTAGGRPVVLVGQDSAGTPGAVNGVYVPTVSPVPASVTAAIRSAVKGARVNSELIAAGVLGTIANLE